MSLSISTLFYFFLFKCHTLSSPRRICQNAAEWCRALALQCPWQQCEVCICLLRCKWGQENEAEGLHQQKSEQVVLARFPVASKLHTASGVVQGWRVYDSNHNHTTDSGQKSPGARPVDEALANLKNKSSTITVMLAFDLS